MERIKELLDHGWPFFLAIGQLTDKKANLLRVIELIVMVTIAVGSAYWAIQSSVAVMQKELEFFHAAIAEVKNDVRENRKDITENKVLSRENKTRLEKK